MNIVNEKAFEEAIEQSLIERGGYEKGDLWVQDGVTYGRLTVK
jgi:hypothetical protein